MSDIPTILLVEDEALILMDLEFAAEDAGFACLSAANVRQAMEHLAQSGDQIDVAILDVSLTAGESSLPFADALTQRGVPFVIYSGELNYYRAQLAALDVPQIAKPSSSAHVVETAQSLLEGNMVRAAVAR